MIKLIDILKEINGLNEDCGCGCNKCEDKTSIKLLKEVKVSQPLQYHLNNKIPLTENIFRTYSKAYFDLINEVRDLHINNSILLCEDDLEIIQLDIGKIGINSEGKEVWLDIPVLEENLILLEVKNNKSHPKLNKPKRGGSKKFYVYVRDPKTKRIKKVSFGDTTGLSVKINDPKARHAFAKRHKCAQATDKTKARYWSCRIGRYWKSLGGGKNFTGYW